MITETVGRYMLRTFRQVIIEHKSIFKQAVIAYAKGLPEPAYEYDPRLQNADPAECNLRVITWKGSEALLRIKDKFMKHLDFEQYFYDAVWKIAIDEVEHDPDHRSVIQFVIEEIFEELLKGNWPPRDPNYPNPRIWTEPRPYHSFNGRSFKQYIREVK